jgi:hypothetical protein
MTLVLNINTSKLDREQGKVKLSLAGLSAHLAGVRNSFLIRQAVMRNLQFLIKTVTELAEIKKMISRVGLF